VVGDERQRGQSQRAAAARAAVARSTLRHGNEATPRSVTVRSAAFAMTPEGAQWLRQVLVAAHWCVREQGGAGVRVVCDFLELSGLSGPSPGVRCAHRSCAERLRADQPRGERAQAHRAESKALIGAFSALDHPYDLQHGQAETPEQLQTQLETVFARLERIAEEVDLSERLCAHLSKAKRLTHSLGATFQNRV
jgi:hypothetical protein